MKHILLLSALLMLCGQTYGLPVEPTGAETQDVQKRYFITLADGSAVPDVNFEIRKTRGDKPAMVAVSKNDGTEVARFYFFSNYRASASSCIGYDRRAGAFVIELKNNDDYRSGKDLLEMAQKFIRPYASGTIYADVPCNTYAVRMSRASHGLRLFLTRLPTSREAGSKRNCRRSDLRAMTYAATTGSWKPMAISIRLTSR